MTTITVEDINSIIDAEAGITAVALVQVAGEPMSKARARFTKRGTTYTPERTRTAEERVRTAYLASVGRIERDADAAFRVEADFYCGTRQRRDVDNMLKLVLDALNGVAWPDDVQVLEVSGRKQFVAKAEARTDVTVFKIDGGMNRPTQPCAQCGTPFLTYESWRSDPTGKKYCSLTCAAEGRRKRRTCDHCGQSFTHKKSQTKRRYCSASCRDASGHVALTCEYCSDVFDCYRSWQRKHPVCPKAECQKAHDAKVHRERRTKHFPATCLICGAGVTRKEYKRCGPCARAGRKVPK